MAEGAINHKSRSRPSIANSSDAEDDLVEVVNSDALPIPRGRRVLQSVVIPKMARSKGPVRKDLLGSSVSSALSGISSIRDTSTEYETPGTSVSTTPAEFTTGKARVLFETSNETGGKRKRRIQVESEEDVLDTSPDALLARVLQEEEYNAGGFKRPKTMTGSTAYKRSTHIDLTEDEDELSSALSIASSDDFQPPQLTASGSRSTRGEASTSRMRAASSSTRKAVVDLDSDISGVSVADSEDEFVDDAVLTDLSDLDMESEEDVPLMDLLNEATSASAPSNSKAPAKAAARRRKEQRRWQKRHAQTHRLTPRERKRRNLEKAHPELRTMWDTLETVAIIRPEQAAQPSSITRKLKSFQLEGLDWMVKQEKTHYKGGLLGDEMGMGKTIQAVSLIMSDFPAKDPTLVVVPPVALLQWSNEIADYTDGKLKVHVYHGSNSKSKGMAVKDFKKFNVVIISYNTLESMYRKETKGWGRGEDLVKEDSPVHAIHFHRLILDEAHSIKSRNTGVAKACFALKGNYKWCLSGTPVQNRIGEFFSLLRFLEVRPFADYFCEKCPCAQLHWSINADYMCDHCGHSAAEHLSIFNQELLNPITGDSLTEREKALAKLHMITARVMLRRMKRDNTSSMVGLA